LLVWEWQSETFVFKQQGHSINISCLTYSADGQFIATGGDDGKLKIWNTTTGFSFVTFEEHSGPINAIVFSPKTNAVFTASVDGTVRAFDLIRYKNFRTMTAPDPTQFSSIAVDSSGEMVCAGGVDSYNIYVWNVQTGKIVDVLSGHEAALSALSFSPVSDLLASVSWDETLRLWKLFDNSRETFHHHNDLLAVAFRHDGKELCTSSLDGRLNFWEPNSGTILGEIDGKKDISGGLVINAPTKSNRNAAKCFTTIAYTTDGTCVLAGGRSNYICLYEVSQRILLRKFKATSNQSFDGVTSNFSLLKDMESSIMDEETEDDKSYIPGAKRAESMKRKTLHPIFLVKGVCFAPTGRAWAAATTEGLHIYSLDETIIFNPFELDTEVTPENIESSLQQKEYLKALVMSFSLNEIPIIKRVFNSVPANDIQFVVQGFPLQYVTKILSFIATQITDSPHLEFHLLWVLKLFNQHGRFLKENANMFAGIFRNLQKNISKQHHDLATTCEDNTYTLDYLTAIANLPQQDSDMVQ